jgi:hypothetical protein
LSVNSRPGEGAPTVSGGARDTAKASRAHGCLQLASRGPAACWSDARAGLAAVATARTVDGGATAAAMTKELRCRSGASQGVRSDDQHDRRRKEEGAVTEGTSCSAVHGGQRVRGRARGRMRARESREGARASRRASGAPWHACEGARGHASRDISSWSATTHAPGVSKSE